MKTNMDHISIIIPTYNRPKSLHSLLESIYRNNKENLKYLHFFIVDDNSTECYRSVINYWDSFLNITYFKKTINQGKNRGIFDVLIRYQTLDKIMIMDDDISFNYNMSDLITIDFDIDSCICLNIYNSSSNVLFGDTPKIDQTVIDFYYKKHKKGDKLWVCHACVFNLDEMNTFFVEDETSYDDCFWVNYLWNLKIVNIVDSRGIVTEYSLSGVTYNLKKIRHNNPFTTMNAYCIYIRKSKGILWRIFNNIRLSILYRKLRREVNIDEFHKVIVTPKEIKVSNIYFSIFIVPVYLLSKIFHINLN